MSELRFRLTLKVCFPGDTPLNFVLTGMIALWAKPSTPSQAAGCVPGKESGIGWCTTGVWESKPTAMVSGWSGPLALFEGVIKTVAVILPESPIVPKLKKSYSLVKLSQVRLRRPMNAQGRPLSYIKFFVSSRPRSHSRQSLPVSWEILPGNTVYWCVPRRMNCLDRDKAIPFNKAFG